MSFFSPLTTSGFICHLNKVSSKPAAAHVTVTFIWTRAGYIDAFIAGVHAA